MYYTSASAPARLENDAESQAIPAAASLLRASRPLFFLPVTPSSTSIHSRHELQQSHSVQRVSRYSRAACGTPAFRLAPSQVHRRLERGYAWSSMSCSESGTQLTYAAPHVIPPPTASGRSQLKEIDLHTFSLPFVTTLPPRRSLDASSSRLPGIRTSSSCGLNSRTKPLLTFTWRDLTFGELSVV